MLKINKVYYRDLTRIFPLLLELNPHLGLSDWAPLFSNIWKTPENFCGFMLCDDDQVVGLLGLLFSQQKLNGKNHRFCDIGSWVVKEKYRNASLALLSETLKMNEYTITTYTTNPKSSRILKNFGFQDYQTDFTFVPTVPAAASKRIKIETDHQLIAGRLNPGEHKIFLDHKDLYCRHILVEMDDSYCYLIVKDRALKRLPSFEICYASDRTLLFQNLKMVVWKLALKFKIFGIFFNPDWTDSRDKGWKWNIPLPTPRLFRSNSLTRKDFDVLYSELFVLKIY